MVRSESGSQLSTSRAAGAISPSLPATGHGGTAPEVVLEGDEYIVGPTDKRSKFVHYRPRTALLNNLEFDHADIFDDLAAIERQFHHLVRTVPASGRIVVNGLIQEAKIVPPTSQNQRRIEEDLYAVVRRNADLDDERAHGGLLTFFRR